MLIGSSHPHLNATSHMRLTSTNVVLETFLLSFVCLFVFSMLIVSITNPLPNNPTFRVSVLAKLLLRRFHIPRFLLSLQDRAGRWNNIAGGSVYHIHQYKCIYHRMRRPSWWLDSNKTRPK